MGRRSRGRSERRQNTEYKHSSIVHAFPGHIACDAGSKSEIVVPIVHRDRVVAVLDVDSYELAAFDDVDAHWLGKVAELAASLRW